MLRITLAVVCGFIAWMLAWFAGEQVLSAIAPDAFGVHQRAFEAALIKGGAYRANSTMLLTHLPLAAIVSLLAGYLCAVIARGDPRARLVLAVLLLAIGVMKAAMSWPLVPLWYHIAYTALLPAMAIVGGRLKRAKR